MQENLETTTTTAPATTVAPRTDRLELVKELPRGSVGVVYKAKSPQMDRLVALRKFEAPEWLDEVKDLLKKIVTDAKVASGLEHPNIARLHTCGFKDFTVFMTSEFIEGQTLKELMASRQPELSEVLLLTKQFCAALDCAHEKGVFHHFLNPSNIKVTADGTLKVLDFGLLRHKDLLSHTPAKKLENEPYLSPEQVRHNPPDRASNMFSAAAIIYQMYTARSPFAGKHLGEVDRSITDFDPNPLNVAHPRVPEAISRVIMKALSKSPTDRFPSGKELFAALEAASKGDPGRSVASTSTRPAVQSGPAVSPTVKSAPPVAASQAIKPAPSPSASQTFRAVPAPAASQTIKAVPSPSASQAIKIPPTTSTVAPGTARATPAPATGKIVVHTSNHWKLVGVVVAGLVVVVGLAMIFQSHPTETPTEDTQVVPAKAKITTSAPTGGSLSAPVIEHTVSPKAGKAEKTHHVEATPVAVTPTDGLLAVTSFPDGAAVEIEGRGVQAGQTPLMIGSLASGTYKITVSKPGFAPEVRSLQVAAGNRTSIDVRLTPLKGTITVTGSPAGASVFINGKDTGKVTPAEFSLDPAVQSIAVRKAGFLDANTEIKLAAGQSVSYAPSLMAAGRTDNIKVVGGMGKLFGASNAVQGMARIEIKTEPKGAKVTINGTTLAKTTPMEIQVEAGNYDITIQKDGYQPFHQNSIIGMEDRVKIDKVLVR
jgi:serine/threonine-protein kinase